MGLALSYYSYVVETAKEQDENYEAMCDISERVSCTKAFMSEWVNSYLLNACLGDTCAPVFPTRGTYLKTEVTGCEVF